MCMKKFLLFALSIGISLSVTSVSYASNILKMAGSYNEGLCPIIFLNEQDKWCKGFIDKEGNLIYYFEIDGDKLIYWDFIDYYKNDNTMLEGYNDGYTSVGLDGVFYILDPNGNIVSKYNEDEVFCYGGGYTWIETQTESSWNTEAQFTYTLFDPSGNQEFSFSNYCGDEGTTIEYLGNHNFRWSSYEVEEGFYFADFHKSVSDYDKHWELKPDDFLIFRPMINEGLFNFTYVDKEGNVGTLNLGDKYNLDYSQIDFIGMTSNYVFILFTSAPGADGCYYRYDINEDKFQKYEGIYSEYLDSWNIYQYYNGIGAIVIDGVDDKRYIGIIDINTFEALGEPIPYENEYRILDGVIDVCGWNGNGYEMIYDYQGNLLSEYDLNWYYDCRVGDGVVVYHSPNDEMLFFDYYGQPLFEQINFSNSKQVNLSPIE